MSSQDQSDDILPSFQKFRALTISVTHDPETGQPLIEPKSGSRIYEIFGFMDVGKGGCTPYIMGVENLATAAWTPPTSSKVIVGWKDENNNGWHDEVGDFPLCGPGRVSARSAGVIKGYAFVSGMNERWNELSSQMGWQEHLSETNDQVIAAFQYGVTLGITTAGDGVGAVKLTQVAKGIGIAPQDVSPKNCYMSCRENFNLEDKVLMEAISSQESVFKGWNDEKCNIPASNLQDADVTVLMQANARCQAEFEAVSPDKCEKSNYTVPGGDIAPDNKVEMIFSEDWIDTKATVVPNENLLYLKSPVHISLGKGFSVKTGGELRVLVQPVSCQ